MKRPRFPFRPRLREVIRQRLESLDEDKKSAVDARQAVSEIRRNLKRRNHIESFSHQIKLRLMSKRAAEWYEQQRNGLGLEFTDRVLESIDRIAEPLSSSQVIESARRCNLDQFPYGLWYTVEDQSS